MTTTPTGSPGEPCQSFIEDSQRRCGDEGDLCEACADREAAYWESQYRKAPLSETDPEAYEEQMRDAGRGHLLPPR